MIIENVIAPASQWRKESYTYDDFTIDPNTGTKTLPLKLQDLPVGVVPRSIIVKPTGQFLGTNVGQVTLDVVDENAISMLSAKVNMSHLTNTRWYRQCALAAAPASTKTGNIYPTSLNLLINQVEAAASANTSERSLITCVADVADSLDGKYFTIGTSRFVWYNTSGGSAVAPVPGGAFVTAIEVAITTGDSALLVAQKTAQAIAATFVTSFDGVNKIQVIDSAATNVTNVGAGNSGFTVSTEQAGGVAPAAFSAITAGSFDILIEYMNINV